MMAQVMALVRNLNSLALPIWKTNKVTPFKQLMWWWVSDPRSCLEFVSQSLLVKDTPDHKNEETETSTTNIIFRTLYITTLLN